MNAISICFIVLFLICVLVGWGRGLFKSILSTASLIVSIVVAVYVAPYVSGYLQENTTVDDDLAAIIMEKLEFTDDKEEMPRSTQVSAVNELSLPEHMKSSIVDNNNSEIYQLLGVSGVYAYIAKSVAIVILNGIVFLGLMLITKIISSILYRKVTDFSKLPIIRSIDKIGGGCLGTIMALIYTWLFFLGVSISTTFEWSQVLVAQIEETWFLKLLYDNNLLLDIVGDITKILFR